MIWFIKSSQKCFLFTLYFIQQNLNSLLSITTNFYIESSGRAHFSLSDKFSTREDEINSYLPDASSNHSGNGGKLEINFNFLIKHGYRIQGVSHSKSLFPQFSAHDFLLDT